MSYRSVSLFGCNLCIFLAIFLLGCNNDFVMDNQSVSESNYVYSKFCDESDSLFTTVNKFPTQKSRSESHPIKNFRATWLAETSHGVPVQGAVLIKGSVEIHNRVQDDVISIEAFFEDDYFCTEYPLNISNKSIVVSGSGHSFSAFFDINANVNAYAMYNNYGVYWEDTPFRASVNMQYNESSNNCGVQIHTLRFLE